MHESEFEILKKEVITMLRDAKLAVETTRNPNNLVGAEFYLKSDKINQDTGLGVKVTIEVCKIEDAYLQGETK